MSRKPVRPRVGDAAARLRVRNQPAENDNKDYGFYNGLTIPQIRKVPGLASVVEDRVEQVRSEVPSLGRRPNAPLGGPQQQLCSRSRSCGSVRQRTNNKHSYVNDLVVLDESVPLSKPVRQTGRNVDLLTGDPETDPSDEEEMGQQMRLVYRMA